MPYQNSPKICPVCKEKADFKFVQGYKNKWGNWSLYKCLKCEVQFWSPFKSLDAEQYEKEDDCEARLPILKKENSYWLIRNCWYMNQFLKHLPHKNPKGKKLLDLGCCTGEFLVVMQKFGYEVCGVDFNKKAINIAKNHLGIENVYKEDIVKFMENKNKEEEYDVITAFEIIEHLDNPKRFLELVYQSLKPGGYFAISTPNQERFWGKIDPKLDAPPLHLIRWTLKSLISFIKKFPFEIRMAKKQIPTDWFISRLRIVMECIFQKLKKFKPAKEKNKSYSNIFEEMKCDIGPKRYKLLRSVFKFIIHWPALFLFYILKFEGGEIYILSKKRE